MSKMDPKFNRASDYDFVRALSTPGPQRTPQDGALVYTYLRQLEAFRHLGEGPLRAIGHSARYERRHANQFIFSFAKRSGGSVNNRRSSDCLALEPCDMIAIDYPDSTSIQHQQQLRLSTANHKSTPTTPNHIIHDNHTNIVPSTSKRALQPPTNRVRGTLPHSSSEHRYTINHSSSSSTVSGDNHSRNGTLTRAGDAQQTTATATCTAASNSVNMKYFESNHQDHRSLVQVNEPCTSQSQYTPHIAHAGQHNPKAPPLNGSPVHKRTIPVLHPHHNPHHASTRSSTSSAYSGSLSQSTAAELDDDFAGLPEASVDSEEEGDDLSCPSGDSMTELRDVVRLALEKEPCERSDDDLRVLLDFMQHMPAFANLPVRVKRQLCQHMVFALVERAGDTVMKHGEQLDSWCVLVNGDVQVCLPDGTTVEYHLGDSFGVQALPCAQYHQGEMRALVDDCQFVLVAQTDYVRLMSTVTEHLQKQTNATGEIISETERRVLDNREGYVLVKGKPDTLIAHLIEDRDPSIDPYYVEDVLLMYRVFLDNPSTLFVKIQQWFVQPALREKVAKIVLLWVNNHFNDFECSSDMMNMLQKFEMALEHENMINHQTLLNIACSVKSRARHITYTRSNRDEVLHFSLLGGTADKQHGLFISKVDEGSQADKVGLKRGDEVLEVNNQNFALLSHHRALDLLRGSTHLAITVKSNLLGFKEMLAASDQANQTNGPGTNSLNVKEGGSSNRSRSSNGAQSRSCVQLPNTLQRQPANSSAGTAGTVAGTAHQLASMAVDDQSLKSNQSNQSQGNLHKIRSLIGRLRMPSLATLPPNEANMANMTLQELESAQQQRVLAQQSLKHSRSNPDISGYQVHPSSTQHGVPDNISQYYKPIRAANPEHVLKIYRADQSFRYLTVYKETTAQNVVQLALQEFGMSVDSSRWLLNEATVTTEGVIKQRRLPDVMCNLAERIALNSRYYLKYNPVTDSEGETTDPILSKVLVNEQLAPELAKEALIQLLQLNAQMVAAQLTLQDFAVFAAIEPTEFVDSLYKKSINNYNWPKLAQFEELVNQEMWWVATEVLSEHSALRRAKLVKKFIKMARHCREFHNFNSMFAIVSGLGKPAVRRLSHTWERLPSKYVKAFDDLQQVFTPSRNMIIYRQHLIAASAEPPVVPLLPLIKKDLSFIHDGNQTIVDGLVNFEKLRMIGKEVRHVVRLASAPYELTMMSEQSKGAGRLNDALLHMNTFEGGSSVATIRKPFQQKTGTQPRKKLYEQALMVRKVKAYLSQLHVVSDEHELDRMSLICEPASNSSAQQSSSSSLLGAAAIRGKRLPSPSPSSLSNQSDPTKRFSAAAAKFGADSPAAIQKMLSLVDHSRVRPMHSGPNSPATPPPPTQTPFSSSAGAALLYSQTSAGGTCTNAVHYPAHRHPQAQAQTRRYRHSTYEPTTLTEDLSAVNGHATSNGSITSADSLAANRAITHAISTDSTDSGHASITHKYNGSPHPNQSLSTSKSRMLGVNGKPVVLFNSAAAKKQTADTIAAEQISRV